MTQDIAAILKEWPYDPERNVRRIIGEDGLPKLQVRQPLGIEQYELTGRPDGFRPGGEESYLHHYEALQARAAAEGGAALILDSDDCAKLRDESVLYYYRYLLCFQAGEYEQVIRDTERNMRAFALVDACAAKPEDKVASSQYWPYIIRMNAMARAILAMQQSDFHLALDIISEASDRIRNLPDVPTETFSVEKARSLSVLEEMAKDLSKKRPPTEMQIVKERLKHAIAAEDYERAAQLRDLLRAMEGA